MSLCFFCLRDANDERVWCQDNPGEGCTYGMRHEFPEEEKPKQVVVKMDRKICLKCGMHPKNPKAVGCEHEFPT